MDRKTGRPIISLKFKAPPAEAEKPAAQAVEAARKPQVSGREPFIVPKVPSRKQGVREVVVAKPAPIAAPQPSASPRTASKTASKSAPKSVPAIKVAAEPKQVPIPPSAFKAATKAATQAVASVIEDPTWQSAELQRSYQDAKLRAEALHRKQAKLVSGIVLKRIAPDLEEGEVKSLAMRAAYAAAFVVLVGDAAD